MANYSLIHDRRRGWSSRVRMRRLLQPLLRRRGIRYALVSVVSVAVAQLVLVLCFGVLHWNAVAANVVATGVATVPSYILSRAWVWGKRGRSRVLQEIVPFWVLTMLGLGISTFAAAAGEQWAAELTPERLVQTAIVSGATLTGFGVVWIGKFAVLHYILFVPVRPEHAATIAADRG